MQKITELHRRLVCAIETIQRHYKDSYGRLRKRNTEHQPTSHARDMSDAAVNTAAAESRDSRRTSKARKGDPMLLGESDSVNFRIAEEYLGISARQRQKLISRHALTIVGCGTNRKITTDSLRHYLPASEKTRTEPN